MKKILLRRINRRKYCPKCGGVVNIEMVDLDGFCAGTEEGTGCGSRLYTLDWRADKKKH